MLEFNNNSIITGYIKQLLTDFNLPKYRIYTPESEIVPSTEIYCIPYIKDGKIMKYINIGTADNPKYEWANINKDNTEKIFRYNKYDQNNTKNLQIRNNIYDTYTHEYLGEYLRFKRDYDGINLMSLYNCFSNNLISNMKIDNFDTTTKDFKTYAIPVKFGKTYTIAVDSYCGIATTIGFYNKQYYTIDKGESAWLNKSIKKYASTQFIAPITITIDKISQTGTTNKAIMALNEQNLKLFIKLPATNNSSIVVVEGNYIGYNDYTYTMFNTKKFAHTIIPQKCVSEDTKIKLYSPLQLLEINHNKQYAFADRLIEYLTDNAITPDDTLSDNIKRLNKVLNPNNKQLSGNWKIGSTKLLYEYITNLDKISNPIFDTLGYVDKDVEQLYKNGNEYLASVDIYNYEYAKSDKE